MLTLSKFKRFLDIPDDRTEKDAVLTELIEDAVGEADRVSNRTLEFSTHTVYLDGTGTNELELTEAPVYRVTELKYWNGEDYVDLLQEADSVDDFIIYKNGFVIALKGNYNFYKGVLNIMVTFTAGYSWADVWSGNIAYFIDNLVMYNNTLYKCIQAHTSASEFDITKWQTLNSEVTPADLEKAIKYNAAILFYESPAGKNLLAKSAENIGGASTKGVSYNFAEMREYYTKTYEHYRKSNL